MPLTKPEPNGAAVTSDESQYPTIAELTAEVNREAHDPNMLPPTERFEFEHAQFIAFVNDLKHSRKGDVIVSLMIPYRYRRLALPLGDAYGIPLSIDCQRWAMYDNARTATEREAASG